MLFLGMRRWFIMCFSLLPLCAGAQDLAGLSLCIDPGHGPGNVNAGPTGLREADINFKVASFLKEYLVAANIDTVLLTHLNNTSDISLSQREQIANNFGVDWFHSVHHNALGSVNTSTRYTLMLLEERRDPARRCSNGSIMGTGQAEWPGESDVMSSIMAERLWQGYRTASFVSRLDWTFYGGCNGGFSLGVLNDLQMPGELSEATFHDHPAEEAKMRNPDFLRLEARALAMSFFEYFNAGLMPTGALSGIISDAETGAPLNGISLTLAPGNLTYTTDNFRNGVYAFDGLAPGTYTITVNVPEYQPFSATVAVAAHAFRYGDARLIPQAPPAVQATTPGDSAQDVYVYEPIRISFSRNMTLASVQAAFHLDPPVAGVFSSVANNPKAFVFNPDFRYDFDTAYVVTIDSTARDQFGRGLDGDGDGQSGGIFSWRFTTMPLNAETPAVVDFFPRNKQTEIFVRDVIEMRFNRAMSPTTLDPPDVKIFALANNLVPARVFASVENGLFKYSFVPTESLLGNRIFTVQLSNSIRDLNGTNLPQALEWRFKTAVAPEALDILSTFASADQPFSDPLSHAQTVGIVADSTSFSLTPEAAVSDSTAGRLRYVFCEPSSGAVFMDLTSPLRLNNNEVAATFVYGDGSENILRWHLRGNDGVIYHFEKTLDWTGWRSMRLETARDSLVEGNRQVAAKSVTPLVWESISVSNTKSQRGEILFEDLLHGHPRSVSVTEPPQPTPAQFTLAQNFPNPFNPVTAIPYFMPSAAAVEIAVYDPLGQRVRLLVEGWRPPGEHRVQWDGRNTQGASVASGVYFVKMISGDFIAVRKLLLMR